MRSVCFRAGVVMSSKMAREDLLEGTDQAGAPSLMPGAVDCVFRGLSSLTLGIPRDSPKVRSSRMV